MFSNRWWGIAGKTFFKQSQKHRTCNLNFFPIKLKTFSYTKNPGIYPQKPVPQTMQWSKHTELLTIEVSKKKDKNIFLSCCSRPLSGHIDQWKPLKNNEKCFLFHLKNSFCSKDI